MSKNYELEVMLKKGPKRLAVLRLMSKSAAPIGSAEISTESGIIQSNVVRILNELESKGAIREVTGRKRDRLFKITRKGIRHLENLPLIF